MGENNLQEFDLEKYLSNGVEKIVKGILKASFKHPKAGKFMVQHGIYSRQAREIRVREEAKGEHIPPFLIASITNQCNLHCNGCYARANKSCDDNSCQTGLMTDIEWDEVFSQAEELGIEFVLLAGGEPFVRKDVLKVAGHNHKQILFPVFTNGTMIDEEYLSMLVKYRNLMPVLSIEGNKQTTDERRGAGIFDILVDTMKRLNENGILFGTSVTVTKQNIDEVMSDEFVDNLEKSGAKAVIYVEYVPVNESTKHLAPDDNDREAMKSRLNELRSMNGHDNRNMVFIAFPGDEKTSGGCLAAGRGFIHINAYGGAEPCPFSPYSDTSIRETSLREALHSPLFRKLQQNGNLTDEHIGGCVLFEQKSSVEALLGGEIQ